MEGYGGVGLRRRARAAELERRRGLHDLPALHLRGRSALRLDGGMQPQTEAVTAGPAPQEEVQALGTHLAEKIDGSTKLATLIGLNYWQYLLSRSLRNNQNDQQNYLSRSVAWTD